MFLKDGFGEDEAKDKAHGAADAQRKVSRPAQRMAADGRQDDLAATLTNNQLLEEELRRYGIE